MPNTPPLHRAGALRVLRHLLPLGLALASATCASDQGGPSSSGVGYFSFRPAYHLAGGASLKQFGIVADSIHIHLTRPVNIPVLDTVVFFPSDSNTLHLALPITLQQSPETLTAVITITAGPTILFQDSVSAEVKDGPPGSTTPPTVTFNYVGPGANMQTLTIVPGDTTIRLGDTLFFSATATDSTTAPIASFYVGWKSSDTTLARINAGGRLIAPNHRGAVSVIGMSPTGISDTSLVTFAPVPVIIVADSGNGQTGIAGDSLAALFVAQVKGADSLPISGVAVRFQATGGGAVRDTLVLTDVQGRARTRAILDTAATGYSFTATVVGTALPAATFSATGTAGIASVIAVTQGNNQTDTTGKTLPLPLGVKVTDAFGNPVGGVKVYFATKSGGGHPVADSAFTAVDGDAQTNYVLGVTIGTDSVTATIAGTSATATFIEHAVANLPSQILVALGNSQSAVVGTQFTDSLKVHVLDISDNPVPGVVVHWATILGPVTISTDSTNTDASGFAAIALSAGLTTGPAQVNATVTGIASPTVFTESVAPGAPKNLTLVSGDTQSAAVGSALALPLTVQVTDVFGNPVPGTPVAFTVVGLGGTVDSATATTNVAGLANSGHWTLGAVAGIDSAFATMASVPADTVRFTATATPPGTTKQWSGAVSSAWTTATNWLPTGVPTGTDNVFIPAVAIQPVSTAAASINDLVMESGTSLTITGSTFSVAGKAILDGSVAGTGTLNLNGASTITEGTANVATVTINANRTLSNAFTLSGSLAVNAGLLTMGGHPLLVAGNLSVGSSGQMVMNAAADSVDVGGTLTFNTSTSGAGDLTAGTLVLRGNLSQIAGAFDNFAASGAHTTVFAGSGAQSISFTSPAPAQSHFGNVTFATPATVSLGSNIVVSGNTGVTSGTVSGIGRTAALSGDLAATHTNWQVSTTQFNTAPTVYPDSMARQVFVGASWTLSKPFTVDSTLTVGPAGSLTLAGHPVKVGTSFTQSGVLVMTNAADTLDVSGAFTVNSSISSVADYSAGLLILRGNFTQTAGAFDNYQPSGTHRTLFAGTGAQSVSFTSASPTQSRFLDVEFANAAGVAFTSNFTVMGTTTVTAGNVIGTGRTATLNGALLTAGPAWQVTTTAIAATPATYPDSLPLGVSLQAPLSLAHNFTAGGPFAITSTGTLTLNGHTFVAESTFTQGGALVMTQATDTLHARGSFTVNTSASSVGSLTNGFLRVDGNFTQTAGSFQNFAPAGPFVTRLGGATGQTVSFTSPSAAQSHFQFLEVSDSANVTSNLAVTADVTLLAGGKVQSTGTATLAGALNDPTFAGWRYQTTSVTGASAVPDSMTTNLIVTGGWTLPKPINLTGTLSVSSTGVVTLAGHRLHVTGNVTQTGRLVMQNAADTVDVGGAFTVNGSIPGTGDLTAGKLLLHGAFTQSAGDFANFAPSGTHLTAFLGTGGHALSFTSASPTQSHFQDLVVTDSMSVSGNLSLLGTTTLAPSGRLIGAGTGFLKGALIDSSLAGWRMVTTELDQSNLQIPSALTTNLVIADTQGLTQHTLVTGNVTITSAGDFTPTTYTLTVTGNFTQSGILGMVATGDSLDIGGTFTVNSSQSAAGRLNNGGITLHGGFTQTAGAFDNFAASGNHRVHFVGPIARTVNLTSPAQSKFATLDIDSTGTITLQSDLYAAGGLHVRGTPATVLTGAAPYMVHTGNLDVDGLTADKVLLQMSSAVNGMTFNNVTFTNQDPTKNQLTVEVPGLGGDTLRLNNVAFGGTPTTGHYVFLSDSVSDGQPATVAFYNSTPLNGALYTATSTVADPVNVLWSHLIWVTEPGTVTSLLPFIPAPVIRAVDPSGLVLAGFSDTVTISLFTDPTSGAAVLANNKVAATGGQAAFDLLTVSLSASGFQFQGSAPSIGSTPPSTAFAVLVPLPPGTTTAFNNNGGDGNWTNPANWTSGVPDSIGNAFVYPNQTVTVDAPSRVNRLTVGTGATIVLSANLAVDSSIDAGHTIAGPGILIAQGTGTISGQLGTLQVTGNYVVAPAETLMATGVTVAGSGILDAGTGTIQVNGNLATSGSGTLAITAPAALVEVFGSVDFSGGNSDLSGGTLRVTGDLSRSGAGAAHMTGALSLEMSGSGHQQNLNYPGTDSTDGLGHLSMFGDSLHIVQSTWVLGGVDLFTGETQVDSTLFATQIVNGRAPATLKGSTLLVASQLLFAGNYQVGTTVFAGTGQTIDPLANAYDTVWVQGTAQLGGTVLAQVFYVVNAGQFDPAGHRLSVAGDFGTGSTATFKMTTPADTILVGGSVYAFGGSTAGLLTHGLLQVAGNFYQGGIPNSIPVETQGPPPALDGFRADSGHVTRFIGSAAQRVIFFGAPVQPADPFSTANSRFGRLELIDGIDSLASTIPVTEDLIVDSAHVVNASGTSGGPAVLGNVQVLGTVPEFHVTNVSLGGVLDFQPAPATYQVGTTLFFGAAQSVPVLPYQDIEVALGQATLSGDLTAQNVKTGVAEEGPGLPGDLRLAGHKLIVAGNLNVVGQGTFTMDDPADSLDVTGGIDMSSGGKSKLLTAGTLVVRGSMYLADSSIVAGGTHRVVFANATPQPFWITSNAGAAPTFNRVTIDAGSVVQFNQFSSGEFIVGDSLVIAGNFQQASGNQRIIARGAFVAPGQMTLSNLELHQGYDNTGGTYANDTYFAGTGQTIPQNTYVNLHVTGTAGLAANLTGPFALGGDLDVENGGTLTLGGRAIDATGQTQILTDGLLVMTNANDTLQSTYGVTFDGRSSVGSLTAGTIVTNYVRQLASTSPQSFYASGTQRTIIRLQNPSPGADNIVMVTPGASQFQTLVFDNLGGPSNNGTFSTGAMIADSLIVQAIGGAQITSANPGLILVGGPLVMNDPVADLNVDTLELHGPVQVGSSSLGPQLIRFAGVGQQIPDTQNYNNIEVTGTATLETGGGFVTGSNITVAGNGVLTLGANSTVRSFGNFTTTGNGKVSLTTPTSSLDVFGNAQFLGGSTEGLLTAGTVTLYGDLNGVGATSDSAYRPGFGFTTVFDGDRTHKVTLPTSFQSKSYLDKVNITANDIVDVNGQSLEMFGRVDLGTSAELINSAGGAPWVEVLGVFTAAAGASIQLPALGFRDTVLVDPAASYNVAETFYGYYNLPVPVLPYQGLQFQGGTPFLGANITATQAVFVNGQGTSADLRLNGFTLNTGDFEAGNGGTLTMDQPNDSLIVGGHAYFQGLSEHGKLTAGLISLGGDFTQDTVFGGSPSAFVTEGTTVELTPVTSHTIHFVTPDSSFFPAINGSTAAPLSLQISGRARIAGELNYYGLNLAGDTLVVDSMVTGGPAGASANLKMLSAGQLYGGTSWSTFAIGTMQFTAPGFLQSLPYDTLIVSDTLRGGFSQLVTANHLEVTGPGNPHHAGAHAGWLFLQGGDGNTTINVSGNVLVSGTDATIYSDLGTLSVTGDLDVTNKALLVSNVPGGCCGTSVWTVGGNAHFLGASTKDSLTQGLLQIAGDFVQGGTDAESFATDTAFKVEFTNTSTPQKITFATPTTIGGGGSQFGALQLDGGTIQLTSDLFTGTFFGNGGTVQSANNLFTATVDLQVDGVTYDNTRMAYVSPNTPFFFDSNNFINMDPTQAQLTVDYNGGGSLSFNTTDFDDAGSIFVQAMSSLGIAYSLDIGGPDQAIGPSKTVTPGNFATVTWGP